MVQAELSFPGFVDGVGAAATYDWIFPIRSWNHKGSWNWYAGVGAGRIGVEYNFWFPLQLSFDWRPLFGPCISWYNESLKGGGTTTKEHGLSAGFYTGGLYAGAISLGVRYRF